MKASLSGTVRAFVEVDKDNAMLVKLRRFGWFGVVIKPGISILRGPAQVKSELMSVDRVREKSIF